MTKVGEIKHAKLLARLTVHVWVNVSESQGSNSASELTLQMVWISDKGLTLRTEEHISRL